MSDFVQRGKAIEFTDGVRCAKQADIKAYYAKKDELIKAQLTSYLEQTAPTFNRLQYVYTFLPLLILGLVAGYIRRYEFTTMLFIGYAILLYYLDMDSFLFDFDNFLLTMFGGMVPLLQYCTFFYFWVCLAHLLDSK